MNTSPRNKRIIRYALLATLLAAVCATQAVASLGAVYADVIYPYIRRVLSAVSSLLPFSLGDLFITLSIAGLIIYPFYARRKKKTKWKFILLNSIEYLAWVYVWLYLAWGLNYSQPGFYQRTEILYSAYSPEVFGSFLNEYITQLNESYIPFDEINKAEIQKEIISQYKNIDTGLGIHRLTGNPRVKTMLFYPAFTKMGISGYMGPFFCEFNLNGDLLPSQYASTYAHELAHLLGITSEAEANFYAYQACTRSSDRLVRFCGYFSVMGHVLGNARGFMPQEEYIEILNRINPEIIELYRTNGEYWQGKYSELLGDIQSWIYDLYLKGNKIASGRKNYSEVVGLLISWWQSEKGNNE